MNEEKTTTKFEEEPDFSFLFLIFSLMTDKQQRIK